MASGVVIPSGSGLVIHLSDQLSQDVRWQLLVSVGLGNIVTKLGWIVAVVGHGWVLIRSGGLVASNHRAASGDVVRRCRMWMLAHVEELGDGWMGLGCTWDLL